MSPKLENVLKSYYLRRILLNCQSLINTNIAFSSNECTNGAMKLRETGFIILECFPEYIQSFRKAIFIFKIINYFHSFNSNVKNSN